MQDLPQEGGISHHRELSVDPEGIDRLDPRDDELKHADARERKREGHKPLRVFAGQQPVEKNTGKRRRHNAEQRRNDRGQCYKSDRGPCADQPLFRVLQHGLRLALGNKAFGGLEEQADAGEGVVKGLHRDGIGPLCGVVEHRLVAPKAVENDKVIEVPMNDAGEFSVRFQPLRLIPVALCGKTVAARGAKNVARVRAVP